jgi:hypothetical protein
MKCTRLLSLSLLIMFLSCPAFADTDNQSGKFIVQIQGGTDFPLYSNVPSATCDLIGECLIGYSVDENITLGLSSGYHNYNYDTGTSINNGTGVDNKYFYNDVPLETVVQYNIGRNKLRPYFLLGLGVCFDTFSFTQSITSSNNVEVYQSPSSTKIDLLIEPGLGLSYELLDHFNLFVQTKLTMDFLGGGLYLYLPVELGCNISI